MNPLDAAPAAHKLAFERPAARNAQPLGLELDSGFADGHRQEDIAAAAITFEQGIKQLEIRHGLVLQRDGDA